MLVATEKKTLLTPMKFLDEAELQDLIAKNPSVFKVISKMNQQDAPLLIIGKEFRVQSGLMDFLAIDVESNLYIIETKLAENPEQRRAVIGQVLEYASDLKDKPFDVFCKQVSDYLGKPLSQAIADFYAKPPLMDGGAEGNASERMSTVQSNLKQGIFRIVVVANQVSFEIQRLFTFLDENTEKNLSFLVLEINKYDIDSQIFLHSNVVWAAKYIKSLFCRRAIEEGEYLKSLSEHVRELIGYVDKWCMDKQLSKVSTTKGISWKSDGGGSVFVNDKFLDTNWSTIHIAGKEFQDFKNAKLQEAKQKGFQIKHGKAGGFKISLDDRLGKETVQTFLSLVYPVLERAAREGTVLT